MDTIILPLKKDVTSMTRLSVTKIIIQKSNDGSEKRKAVRSQLTEVKCSKTILMEN